MIYVNSRYHLLDKIINNGPLFWIRQEIILKYKASYLYVFLLQRSEMPIETEQCNKNLDEMLSIHWPDMMNSWEKKIKIKTGTIICLISFIVNMKRKLIVLNLKTQNRIQFSISGKISIRLDIQVKDYIIKIRTFS